MKTKYLWPLAGIVMLCAGWATYTITQLTANNNPSAGTLIEVYDPLATPKSGKVTLANYALVTAVSTATNNSYTSAKAYTDSVTNTVVLMATNSAKAYTDAHSGGAGIAGTVINTGASTANAVPVYTGTDGTNVEPSTVTIAAGTISAPGGISAGGSGTSVFTNGLQALNVTASRVAMFNSVKDLTNVVATGPLLGTGAAAATADIQATLGQVYQATNATLTALSTNTTTGTGRIVLESAAGGGAGMVGTVSNAVASAGLLAVDATKTNGIAATKAHVTNALGIFNEVTTSYVGGDAAMHSLIISSNYIDVPYSPVTTTPNSSTYQANRTLVQTFKTEIPFTTHGFSYRIGTTASGNFGVAIYDFAGTTRLVDSGPISTASGGVIVFTFASPVTLSPGVYRLAWTVDNGTATLSSIVLSSIHTDIVNGPVWRYGVSTTDSSGGQLPASLGSVTTLAGSSTNLCISIQ